MMKKEEILQFLSDHPFFSLATSEGNIPHVRTLMLHKADETGIYFMVGKLKEVYRQLSLNPEVEMCFRSEKLQIRIRGKVENCDKNITLKQEILAARPFLKETVERTGLKSMGVFCLKNGIAWTWALEDGIQPKVETVL